MRIMQVGRNYEQIIPTCIPFPLPMPGPVKKWAVCLHGSRTRAAPCTSCMGQPHGMLQEVKRPYAPIYGLLYSQLSDKTYDKFVMDKQRFIIPPVYDKSTLLSHESIRSLWYQANHLALGLADRLYVIGYSLPETDFAMRSLLWQGARRSNSSQLGKKLLYVVDLDKKVGDRYAEKLGQYYDVCTDWVGESEVFNDFVDWYTQGCT